MNDDDGASWVSDNSDVEAPPPPFLGFKLPFDVKIRIAELAHAADEGFQDRVGPQGDKSLPTSGKREQPGAEESDGEDDYWRDEYSEPTREMAPTSWWGRTTNALFAVDKEFNAIATPLLFKTICALQPVDNFFAYSIVPLYSHYIKKAVLVDVRSAPSAQSAQDILGDLPESFPSSPDSKSSSSTMPAQAAFNVLATKIRRLRLINFPSRCLPIMVGRFSNLKELSIEGDATFPAGSVDKTEHEEFQAALLQLRGLVKLRVAILSDIGGSLRMEHTWRSKWASIETLRHFSCSSLEFTPALFNFIGKLAPNLVSLKLNYEHFRPKSHLSVGLGATLPQDIDVDEGINLVAVLRQHVLPHLIPSGGLYQLLHRQVFPVRTLLSFKFGENLNCDAPLPPSISVHVAEMARSLGIVARPFSGGLLRPRLRNAFDGEGVDEYRDRWEPDADEEEEIESGIWLKDMKDTLAYGGRLTEECERTKDRAKLKELIELLRPLNARREVELD
ncbi:hypothetical protein BCR35DRAFT_330277 [Leucosporidium creatinivorum]|uniref:Proteophosphoglycan ppg4 n=1 Tax=Leucosporidium creatinivorum TaxID=106004 RepID=A0A1Y2FVK6_9BASI|nr:hypothetical protein BCR35DRAFT_330277 [Leucosporidium creatinivorum]